jgi:hypothetical protein
MKLGKWTLLRFNDRYLPTDRDLFDFFDEQGIGIFIDFIFDHTDKGKLKYLYRILGENIPTYAPFIICPTRREAEEQAFQKAFQMLEKILY